VLRLRRNRGLSTVYEEDTCMQAVLTTRRVLVSHQRSDFVLGLIFCVQNLLHMISKSHLWSKWAFSSRQSGSSMTDLDVYVK
jgi:hypothetical protein